MIYVVGSLNMDLCIETPYIPKKGETITGKNFMTNGGGKGANQSVAAGKLGGKVAMCGNVGNDAFGEELIGNLKKAGVECSHVKALDGYSTGIAVIVLSEGDNRIILDKGANAALKKEDIDDFLKNGKKGDVYLTQLENPIEIIGYGLKTAKEKGLTTILNPAPANKDILPYLCYADIVTPNETELEIFGGREKMFEIGVKKLVVTLGGAGYEICDEKGSKRYPCIKVKPVDTTAAGDTFCGGLAVGLSEGKTIEEACAFGSKAASIACTRRGAQQSVPTKKEVEEFTVQRL